MRREKSPTAPRLEDVHLELRNLDKQRRDLNGSNKGAEIYPDAGAESKAAPLLELFRNLKENLELDFDFSERYWAGENPEYKQISLHFPRRKIYDVFIPTEAAVAPPDTTIATALKINPDGMYAYGECRRRDYVDRRPNRSDDYAPWPFDGYKESLEDTLSSVADFFAVMYPDKAQEINAAIENFLKDRERNVDDVAMHDSSKSVQETPELSEEAASAPSWTQRIRASLTAALSQERNP